MAQFRGGEYLESRLCPFVESLEHCNRQGVLQRVVARLVVDGVAAQSEVHVIGVGIEVCWCLVSLVNPPVVVEAECVDEARYRHVFIFHPLLLLLPLSLQSSQTVGCRLPVHGDSVSRRVAFFLLVGLVACYGGVFGASECLVVIAPAL